jgi:hypothetical protein
MLSYPGVVLLIMNFDQHRLDMVVNHISIRGKQREEDMRGQKDRRTCVGVIEPLPVHLLILPRIRSVRREYIHLSLRERIQTLFDTWRSHGLDTHCPCRLAGNK